MPRYRPPTRLAEAARSLWAAIDGRRTSKTRPDMPISGRGSNWWLSTLNEVAVEGREILLEVVAHQIRCVSPQAFSDLGFWVSAESVTCVPDDNVQVFNPRRERSVRPSREPIEAVATEDLFGVCAHDGGEFSLVVGLAVHKLAVVVVVGDVVGALRRPVAQVSLDTDQTIPGTVRMVRRSQSVGG